MRGHLGSEFGNGLWAHLARDEHPDQCNPGGRSRWRERSDVLVCWLERTCVCTCPASGFFTCVWTWKVPFPNAEVSHKALSRAVSYFTTPLYGLSQEVKRSASLSMPESRSARIGRFAGLFARATPLSLALLLLPFSRSCLNCQSYAHRHGLQSAPAF